MDINNLVIRRVSMWMIALFIFFSVSVVFTPALKNGFVWDDAQYVSENEDIKLKGAGLLKWAFTAVVSANWHPLTLLSYAIDYRLWGMEPWGYHLSNITAATHIWNRETLGGL